MILLLSQETDLCLVLMINQSISFVYRFHVLKLNPTEYLSFTNCYGKANKETHTLAERHVIRHRLFDSEPKENVFYLYAAIFEIPM